MDDFISRQEAIYVVLQPGKMPWQMSEEIRGLRGIPAPRWTLMTERLPDVHGQEYLVSIDDGDGFTTCARWDDILKDWYNMLYEPNIGDVIACLEEDVVAWMPLPKPINGETDGMPDVLLRFCPWCGVELKGEEDEAD